MTLVDAALAFPPKGLTDPPNEFGFEVEDADGVEVAKDVGDDSVKFGKGDAGPVL